MSQQERQQERKEQARTSTEANAASEAHRVGVQSQFKSINKRKHNPQFYDRYTRTSLEDSEKWSHLTNEFATWLADDHVLANRRQVYRLQRELLNQARADQAVARRSPGARLKEKPLLNALAQDVHPELEEPVPLDAAGQKAVPIRDPAYVPPASASEVSAIDDVANVATARQSMGVDKAGTEALTTATTESRTVREDETESQGKIAQVAEAFD